MADQPKDKQELDLKQFIMNPVEVRAEKAKYGSLRLWLRIIVILLAVALLVAGVWTKSHRHGDTGAGGGSLGSAAQSGAPAP